MSDYLLGMNAKIYQGEKGAELETLSELSNVRDVTLNLSAGEADVTTRANSGWKSTAPTLRECSVDFEMLWKPADTGFQAIKAAFLGGTQVRLAVLTGAKDEPGTEGPVGDFTISQFNRSEPLEEGVKVAVTAKLVTFDEWLEVEEEEEEGGGT